MPKDLASRVHLAPAVVDERGVGLNHDVDDEQKIHHPVDDEQDEARRRVDSRRQKPERERRHHRDEHQQHGGDHVPLPGEIPVGFDDPARVEPLGEREPAAFDHRERVTVLVPRVPRHPDALLLIVQLPVVEGVFVAVVPLVPPLLLPESLGLRRVPLLRVSRHGVLGARHLHVREALGEGLAVDALLHLVLLLLGLLHGLGADVVPVQPVVEPRGGVGALGREGDARPQRRGPAGVGARAVDGVILDAVGGTAGEPHPRVVLFIAGAAVL